MTVIGYMGIPLSNSEAAAKEFVKKHRLKEPEYVPLMCSKDTLEALVKDETDYAVVATKNSTAGIVKETEAALKGKNLEEIDSIGIPIHHCLFVKNADCDIEVICSHIQALGQCKSTLATLYPGVRQEECEDTAYAAERLSKNEFPDNYGVLCRKEAGEFYKLHLVKENLEDNPRNITYFSLFCKP